MIKMREVGQVTARNLATWPGTAARAVRAAVRPTPAVTPPPYVKCTGCGKGGRDDQQVPDPDQFVKIKGADDTPGKERAEGDIKLIDAAPVYCSCGRWFHAIGCYGEHRHD